MEMSNTKSTIGHLGWSSPKPLDQVEGYALALCLRLAQHLPRTKRVFTPPTTLTPELVDEIVESYACIRDRIRKSGKALSDEALGNLILDLSDEDVEAWLADHKEDVEQARKDLMELAAVNGSIGFRCVG